VPSAPDIPTVDEAGLPGFYISVWHGLWAPKNTPPDVVSKLNEAVVQALSDPSLRKHFAELGLDVPERDGLSPLALTELQKREIAKWWPIIRAANAKPQ